jgi:hypothetical protein
MGVLKQLQVLNFNGQVSLRYALFVNRGVDRNLRMRAFKELFPEGYTRVFSILE